MAISPSACRPSLPTRPLPPIHPRAPRRRWWEPIVAALGALLVAVLGACATIAQDQVSTLALTPASARVAVHFAPTMGQLAQLASLRARLETIPEYRAAFATAQQSAILDGLTLEADVLPWLAADATLAVWPARADPARTEVGLFLSSRDLRASKRFTTKLQALFERTGEPMEKDTFANTSYVSRPNGPAIATVKNIVVIATSPNAMKEVIGHATRRATPSLNDSRPYIELVGRLPAERLGEVYIAALSSLLPPDVPRTPADEALLGVATAPRLTADGIALDSIARYDLTRIGGPERALLLQGGNPLRALGALPDETVAAVALRDLNLIWQATVAPLRNDPAFQERLASFERSTGLNLEADILSWLTGEVGLALVEAPTAGQPLGGLLVIEVTDRPLVEARLARIAAALERQGLRFAPGTVGGVPMRVAETGLPGVGYGFVGDFLVIGSSPEVLARAVDVGAGALPSAPRFAATRAALPARVTRLSYLDVAALRRLAPSLATTPRDQQSYRQAEPWLRPLAAIGSANAVTTPDGFAGSTLFVLLDQWSASPAAADTGVLARHQAMPPLASATLNALTRSERPLVAAATALLPADTDWQALLQRRLAADPLATLAGAVGDLVRAAWSQP